VPGAHDNRHDLELLARLASGSADALAELYDRQAPSLLRHAIALTRRRVDAEDLVHAVFLKLATTGPELLGVREPQNYLHRMIHTTWIDVQRRVATGRRVMEQAEHRISSDDWPLVGGAERGIDIGRALDALPPVQRQAIVLHVVEGFSFREIGRLTGVSLFTAAGRYRLAIGRLRDALHTTSGDKR
jgi:RNA polymerase sigma-70 factor, ECF subfamily